jgi:hypothetical protein
MPIRETERRTDTEGPVLSMDRPFDVKAPGAVAAGQERDPSMERDRFRSLVAARQATG